MAERFTPRRIDPKDATAMMRSAEVRSPRTQREIPTGPAQSMKDIWALRAKQTQEWASCGESQTVEQVVVGAHAQQSTSHRAMQHHVTKHIRSMFSPRDLYQNPVSINMEIGWHLGADGLLSPNPSGPRTNFPKSTCPMTQHQDNMYTTNSQNIIRRM
mmetsp:Transcript_45059/g.81046  ORF Transcript_45059/g.81046 Transcript_45059/m.81046 type:complete len:158 (-) Transcript_45059:199-672(-)